MSTTTQSKTGMKKLAFGDTDPGRNSSVVFMAEYRPKVPPDLDVG